MARNDHWKTPAHEALRAGPGFELSMIDTRSTPGWTGDKKAADARLASRGEEMSEVQERLFADGRTGGTRSVLLVLQGLDTAGKGGICLLYTSPSPRD